MEAVAEREELLDLATAARRLGLGRPWLNVLVLQGRLPAERRGQQWFIRRQDFDAFADSYHPRNSPLGVTYPAFVAVAEREGATVEDVAGILGRPKRTVLDWLQTLDRRGLVERRRGHHPRDPAHCYLTAAGRDLYRKEQAGEATRDNP